MIIDSDQGCVLAVDDQKSERLIIEEALGGYYKVITAADADSAIELARQHLPDVILLDIDLPGTDGFELCQTLQQLPGLSGSSFIFITGHQQVDFETRALRLGAADFIQKPLHLEICRLRVKSQMLIQQQANSLNRAFKQLHREKEHLFTILRSISDAVITTDKYCNITFMNPVAERLTGWSERHAAGIPIQMVMDLRDATTNDFVQNPVHIAVEQGRTVTMTINAKIVCKDGNEYRIENTASPVFDSRDHALMGGVIVFQDVSDAVAMSTQMNHLTSHDHLTSLPNRMLLHDRMSQAINAQAEGFMVAVILIDIDNFKYLNDTFGHQTGDCIIMQIAKRLTTIPQGNATVSRIGGDEFVILLPACPHITQINQIAEKILTNIRAPISINNEEHRFSVSMGISVYPADASSAEELISHADTAMYKVKNTTKNGYVYYSDELYNGLKERVNTEKLIHQRLEENAVLVYFQPKYELATGEMRGVEALARMKDPSGGLLSPQTFIPVAEESGLIGILGNQVLDKSCAAAKRWLDNGHPLVVAVNIGASQFNDINFAATVADMLLKYNLPARYLELEITESALIANINSAKKAIRQLQKIGVSIALDDFGTGYSSLSYLRSFNFNVLKIDRSFVKDIDSDEQAKNIIRAIVNLAKSLKLLIVCEGIETRSQLLFLNRIGCHEGQGFYYTPPLPLKEFEALKLPQLC